MKNLAFTCLILSLLIIYNTESAPLKDFLSEQIKPWHGVVIQRFYGPWNILRKKNGDYVDYNDYADHVEDIQLVPFDLTYYDVSIPNPYRNNDNSGYTNYQPSETEQKDVSSKEVDYTTAANETERI